MKRILSFLFLMSLLSGLHADQILDSTNDEQSVNDIQPVFRKMDDDFKEGLAYFSELLRGIFTMIEGKQNSDRATIVNGVNQFMNSLVDIVSIGQKRHHLATVTSKEELSELLICALHMAHQADAKKI